MSKELVEVKTTPPVILRPIVQAGELVEAHKEVTKLISAALESGRDYGVIPGTRGKPTLLKPGAERLLKAFGCHVEYQIVAQETDHDRKVPWQKKSYGKLISGESIGLYRYVVNCIIVASNGAHVGSGLGSCSTLESKYIDRPRDLENTVLKMAQKRALVAATLNTFGLSDSFTQDVGDDEEDAADMPPRSEPPVQDAEYANKQKSEGGFDPNNQKHQDWLIRELKKRGISDDLWDDIAARLKGRPSSELQAVLLAQ